MERLSFKYWNINNETIPFDIVSLFMFKLNIILKYNFYLKYLYLLSVGKKVNIIRDTPIINISPVDFIMFLFIRKATKIIYPPISKYKNLWQNINFPLFEITFPFSSYIARIFFQGINNASKSCKIPAAINIIIIKFFKLNPPYN